MSGCSTKKGYKKGGVAFKTCADCDSPKACKAKGKCMKAPKAFKKGGSCGSKAKPKAYKKGGSVRGVGCAQRGATPCKVY